MKRAQHSFLMFSCCFFFRFREFTFNLVKLREDKVKYKLKRKKNRKKKQKISQSLSRLCITKRVVYLFILFCVREKMFSQYDCKKYINNVSTYC